MHSIAPMKLVVALLFLAYSIFITVAEHSFFETKGPSVKLLFSLNQLVLVE